MPHTRKSRVDIGPKVTTERARERAYLLYSRGHAAKQYLSLLEGRRAPRLLSAVTPNLSVAPSQASGELLTSPLGISE
jgi:hypothetical protein